jgi:hypothetical protein
MLIKFTLLAFIWAILTGCYPMPTEDDYSLIPTTNNPSVTREKAGFNPSAIKY